MKLNALHCLAFTLGTNHQRQLGSPRYERRNFSPNTPALPRATGQELSLRFCHDQDHLYQYSKDLQAISNLNRTEPSARDWAEDFYPELTQMLIERVKDSMVFHIKKGWTDTSDHGERALAEMLNEAQQHWATVAVHNSRDANGYKIGSARLNQGRADRFGLCVGQQLAQQVKDFEKKTHIRCHLDVQKLSDEVHYRANVAFQRFRQTDCFNYQDKNFNQFWETKERLGLFLFRQGFFKR